MPDVSLDPTLLAWLLDVDPALRWQVERDLAGAPAEVWQATRARVASEGFGAALLAHQDPDGQWAGGAYFPADHVWSEQEGDEQSDGQPWTATTWSLKSLREWGLDAAVLAGTADLLAAGSRWEYEDRPYWEGEVDACINAYTLASGAWLGADVSGLERWFVEHRLEDGGWNCEWVNGATRSSFHSTLNAIEGLRQHEGLTGGSDALRAARHTAEEYLLRRRLMFRLSTGEPVDWWVDTYVYPFRWFYSALRALDHFCLAARLDETPPDPRLADAVGAVRSARGEDGRWRQQHRHPGQAWFEVDVPPGEPSPWLTFHATRALSWWDAAGG